LELLGALDRDELLSALVGLLAGKEADEEMDGEAGDDKSLGAVALGSTLAKGSKGFTRSSTFSGFRSVWMMEQSVCR
jgi:hypothetical protein